MTWHQRIDAAEKRKRFFIKEQKLAKSWVTCACGEQDKRIAREIDDAPVDNLLFNYGHNFYVDVMSNDFQSARENLFFIETRAAELIAIYEKEIAE